MGRPINYDKYTIENSQAPSSALRFSAIFSGETNAEDATLVKQIGTDTVRLRSVVNGTIEDFVLSPEEITEPGQASLSVSNVDGGVGLVVKLMQHRVNVFNTTEGEVRQYNHRFGGVNDSTDPDYVYFSVVIGPTAPPSGDWTLDYTDPDVTIEFLQFTGIGSYSVSAIEYSIDGGEAQFTDNANVGVHTILADADVGTYSVRIRYTTNAGTSDWSAPKTVEVV